MRAPKCPVADLCPLVRPRPRVGGEPREAARVVHVDGPVHDPRSGSVKSTFSGPPPRPDGTATRPDRAPGSGSCQRDKAVALGGRSRGRLLRVDARFGRISARAAVPVAHSLSRARAAPSSTRRPRGRTRGPGRAPMSSKQRLRRPSRPRAPPFAARVDLALLLSLSETHFPNALALFSLTPYSPANSSSPISSRSALHARAGFTRVTPVEASSRAASRAACRSAFRTALSARFAWPRAAWAAVRCSPPPRCRRRRTPEAHGLALAIAVPVPRSRARSRISSAAASTATRALAPNIRILPFPFSYVRRLRGQTPHQAKTCALTIWVLKDPRDPSQCA